MSHTFDPTQRRARGLYPAAASAFFVAARFKCKSCGCEETGEVARDADGNLVDSLGFLDFCDGAVCDRCAEKQGLV